MPTSAADLNKNPSRYVLDATHELCVCHGGGQVCSFECCVKFLMVVLSVQCAASWWELACFDALDRLLFLRNTQQSQHLSFKTCLSTPVLYETALFFAEHSPHSICHSFKPVFIRQCCMRLSVFAEHSCHNICHCFKSLLADLQEIYVCCFCRAHSSQSSCHLKSVFLHQCFLRLLFLRSTAVTASVVVLNLTYYISTSSSSPLPVYVREEEKRRSIMGFYW